MGGATAALVGDLVDGESTAITVNDDAVQGELGAATDAVNEAAAFDLGTD